MQRIQLYKPGEVPVLGENSAVDPASLQNGEWQRLENVRSLRRKLTLRWGQDELSAVPTANASYRGHWVGFVGGSEKLYAAFRVSGATRIYEYDLLSPGWTERGSSATERFATDGDVSFAACRCRGFSGDVTFAAKNFVLATNGADDPLLIDTSTSPYVFKASSFEMSDPAPQHRPVPYGWVHVYDHSNLSYTSLEEDGATSQSQFTMANSAVSTSNNHIVLSLNTSTGVDFTTYVDWGMNSTQLSGSSMDFSDSRQLQLVIDGSPLNSFLNYCDIELYNGSAWVKVHQCEGFNRGDVAVVTVSGNIYVAGIYLNKTTSAALTTVSRMRLTAKKIPNANLTENITNIMASGFVPGESEYALSMMYSASRVESNGVVCKALSPGPLSNFGAGSSRTQALPNDENLFYIAYLDVLRPSSTVDANRYMVYRKEPGETDYFYCSALVLSSYDATVLKSADNCAPQDRDLARTAPSAANRGPVKAKHALIANNRLYLSAPSGAKSEVWVSSDNDHLRFSAILETDSDGAPLDTSPVYLDFPGEEVQCSLMLPGIVAGASNVSGPVLMFTSRATYLHYGNTALDIARSTKISAYGTLYPRSVAEQKGSVYYLDTEKVIRRISGGSEAEPLSLWRIDDQLEAGDFTRPASIVWKDAYRLSYRDSGQSSNRKVNVFEERLNGWFRDSYPNGQDHAGYAYSASLGKLLAITDAGKVYEVEKSGQTTDEGTAITATLKTRRLHTDLWGNAFWGRVGMVAEDSASSEWATTRTDPYNASNPGTASGEINTDVTTAWAWRWDQKDESPATGAATGIASLACDLTLSSSTYAPGKTVHAIVMETERRDDGADVA
jgi:uncharacterized protein (UPF0333 family)